MGGINFNTDTHEEVVEAGSINDYHKRILGFWDLVWLWLSMTAQMGMFLLGAYLLGGLSFLKTLIAVCTGGIVISIVMTLNGDMGMKYGITFSSYLEIPFGEKGRRIPTLMRVLMGVFWFGIQTYYAAQAIDIATIYLLSYSNWILWYILFAVIQILISIGGITRINKLEVVCGPAIILLSLWLIYTSTYGNSLKELFKYRSVPLNFWHVVTVALSYWATISLNVSDFTRYAKYDNIDNNFIKRNIKCFLSQIIGVIVGMVLFISVGMIGKYYTGFENPIYMITSTLDGIFMI